MARYVDGFLLPIPRTKVAAYRRIAAAAGKVWRKYGALEYCECIADDPRPKGVKVLFPKIISARRGEVVFFSYIVFKSKKDRDRINAKVLKDTNMVKSMSNPMPFDVRRMAYAGFRAVVDL